MHSHDQKTEHKSFAQPEEVRSFYANTFKQNGWAGQEFTYSLMQGQRQLKVEIDPKARRREALHRASLIDRNLTKHLPSAVKMIREDRDR